MPHTLLLADDSVTIQRVIELTFADEDIKVIAVSDGDQAVSQLDAVPPDIVLADIGMPGKNGYEVAAYVKQSPRLQHIPVVLLTGAFEPVDQAKAASVGCDGVLAKPFEPQLVITRVKELLTKGGRPAPAAVSAAPAVPVAPPASPAAFAPAAPSVPSAAATAERQPAVRELDDYFDRLDAAFSTLSPTAAIAAQPPATDSVSSEPDWFANEQSSTAPADLPLSYGSPQVEFERPVTPEPVAVPPPIPTTQYPAPVASAPAATPAADAVPAPQFRAPAFPPLAEAFTALLAAEQRSPDAAAAPVWPAATAAAAAVTEDTVEQVVQRVLDRLSDVVVRETVTEIVSKTAERLVREEIERIKAAINEVP